MADDQRQSTPIPAIHQQPISELIESAENGTAFANALRRVLREKQGSLAAHGSSPVIDSDR